MGKRGPVPKPAKLRLLEGNPGYKPIPEAVPVPEDLIAEPDWRKLLSDDNELVLEAAVQDAHWAWETCVAPMAATWVGAQTDGLIFIEVCRTWARLQAAERVLGMARGEKQVREAVLRSKNWRTQLLALLVQAGLTPASRLRMTKPVEKDSAAISRVLD